MGIIIPIIVAIIAVAALAIVLFRGAPDTGVGQPTIATEAGPSGGQTQLSQPEQPQPQPQQPAQAQAQQPSAQSSQPSQPAQPAQPTQPSRPAGAAQGGGTPSRITGMWPGFRGPNLNNISPERVGLARTWPPSGPKKLWAVKLGRGHAGAAIRDGRVYVLDYDESAGADTLRCLSLDDGREIWKQAYPVQLKYNHGLSRTVPAVTGKYVVTLGPRGDAMCCRTDDGKVVWKKNLVSEYGLKVPSWYFSQCPLIDGGKAIIATGGKALMIAVELSSGKVVWTCPNPGGWEVSYASITPMNLGGVKTYVYPTTKGVVGVSTSGKLLWKFPGWKVSTANCPSPVDCGGGRIFLTGGYSAGSMMIKVSGGSASEMYRLPQSTFGSHQHTPILYQNHLFGVNIANKQFTCLDLKGNVVWSSGHTARFGLGPYIMAEGMFYVLSDDGTLVLVDGSTSGYKELARAQVVGANAWGPMAIAGGRLVLRDEDTMVCLDVT
ncbi:MAG: PQQ-binding-like beta-propeller repeat protein [Armatimonadetes bacterium]|nr:PQQ-binding-like beta-propeller repeat protein [Armatimonadota bacterium]